jgi:protein arginine kinase
MNALLTELARAAPPWISPDGPAVVVCSRVRLVRNLANRPFPQQAADGNRKETLYLLYGALDSIDPGFAFLRSDELTDKEQRFLVERRLAGRNQSPVKNRGLALPRDPALSLRFNDGEHLKIAALRPGMGLADAYEVALQLDDAFAQRLAFAFSEKSGYLTANPANAGTGLRVSAMLFLPGLVGSEKMIQIIHAAYAVGCGIGGFFGSLSNPEGCLFQIHNRHTLGESEETILKRLLGLVQTIEERELEMREELAKKHRDMLHDRMARVLALLSQARSVGETEGLVLLSQARLAVHLDMLPPDLAAKIDGLMASTLSIHLQLTHGAWLSDSRLDQLRAEKLRGAFSRIELQLGD